MTDPISSVALERISDAVEALRDAIESEGLTLTSITLPLEDRVRLIGAYRPLIESLGPLSIFRTMFEKKYGPEPRAFKTFTIGGVRVDREPSMTDSSPEYEFTDFDPLLDAAREEYRRELNLPHLEAVPVGPPPGAVAIFDAQQQIWLDFERHNAALKFDPQSAEAIARVREILGLPPTDHD